MEARIALLEGDMKEVKADVKEIKSDLKTLARDIVSLSRDISRIDGRTAQMATVWQLIGIVIAVMAATVAIVRFGTPH